MAIVTVMLAIVTVVLAIVTVVLLARRPNMVFVAIAMAVRWRSDACGVLGESFRGQPLPHFRNLASLSHADVGTKVHET